MRLTHLLIVLAIVGVIGAGVLVVAGYLVIGPMDVFGLFKTPELSQKSVNEAVDKGVQTAQGFTPAKSPTEAMEHFREAILKRNFKAAGKYCSKPYADALERAHGPASELAEKIDQVRDYGQEKGLLKDRVILALNKMDPFPKNFKLKAPPEQKGDKAVGFYTWDVLAIKDPSVYKQIFTELDPSMFNVLALPISTANMKGIEIGKEGEEWKLNVPITPQWDTLVTYFIDRHKTYLTGLSPFRLAMDNDRYTTPQVFETELMRVFTDAKK